ncbi:MAG: helix-turn-helix domain-containing protein [Candidatus Nanopelagicales bacterium]
MASRWPRDAYIRAVWASDLKPLARLIALAYADHARKGDTAWLTLDRLVEVTGMSRDAANRNLRRLVDSGWLLLVEQGRQHRASRYRLIIASSTGDVLLNPGSSSTGDDTSSTSPDTSSTGDVLDLQETSPETAAAAPPLDGIDLDDFLAARAREAS